VNVRPCVRACGYLLHRGGPARSRPSRARRRVLSARLSLCGYAVVCAVDGFSVGTYSFSCAKDCLNPACAIDYDSQNLHGTLPDVFDRLTCASKIIHMYCPSVRSRTMRRVCVRVRTYLCARVCVCVRVCSHSAHVRVCVCV
jgi:hypothetical protein